MTSRGRSEGGCSAGTRPPTRTGSRSHGAAERRPPRSPAACRRTSSPTSDGSAGGHAPGRDRDVLRPGRAVLGRVVAAAVGAARLAFDRARARAVGPGDVDPRLYVV